MFIMFWAFVLFTNTNGMSLYCSLISLHELDTTGGIMCFVVFVWSQCVWRKTFFIIVFCEEGHFFPDYIFYSFCFVFWRPFCLFYFYFFYLHKATHFLFNPKLLLIDTYMSIQTSHHQKLQIWLRLWGSMAHVYFQPQQPPPFPPLHTLPPPPLHPPCPALSDPKMPNLEQIIIKSYQFLCACLLGKWEQDFRDSTALE